MMEFNKRDSVHHLECDGFYIYQQDIENKEDILRKARSLCSSQEYKRGGNYRGDFSISPELKAVVYSSDLDEVFSAFSVSPKKIFITFEDNHEAITRNNYLHFDRSRCMKSLVYLEDTDEDCGPFTIVKKSHRKGKELRSRFANGTPYENIKNRIDIDYPEIEYELFPITGPVGTTVLFDTDLFHMGGSVKQGRSRTVIRSHWY
jgi:hypothetical protein